MQVGIIVGLTEKDTKIFLGLHLTFDTEGLKSKDWQAAFLS
jgi:hypothetical protein